MTPADVDRLLAGCALACVRCGKRAKATHALQPNRTTIRLRVVCHGDSEWVNVTVSQLEDGARFRVFDDALVRAAGVTRTADTNQ